MVRVLSYIDYSNQKSLDIDLIIEKTPDIPSSNIEYEIIKVDGGENLTKIKGFKDIPLKFDFAYLATPEEYIIKKSRIDNWLLSSIDKYLTYSLDEFASYKVKQIEISATATTGRIMRHFSVTFICQGLKYMASGLNPIVVSNGMILNNFGNYEAKPLLKIYGSGNIYISIGGKNFTINNISEFVNIDSEIKECFKDNSTNKGKDMIGDWPILPIGSSLISWTGNVTKVEITPRWRCY
jgi:phage-related protein